MTQTSLLNVPPCWVHKIGGSEFRIMRLNDNFAVEVALNNPHEVYEYLRPRLAESLSYRPDVENFIVIHLNTRKKPIGFEVVSNGTLDTLLVHPREVFRSAILANSAGIILAHNHPSGESTPSEADIKVTRELMRAGQLLKIEVVDHVILGHTKHTSLREAGYFYS